MDSFFPVHAETKALSANAVANTRSIALAPPQIEKSQNSGIGGAESLPGSTPHQFSREEVGNALIELAMKRRTVEPWSISAYHGGRCGKRLTARRQEGKVTRPRYHVVLSSLRQSMPHHGGIPLIWCLLIVLGTPQLNRNEHVLQFAWAEQEGNGRCGNGCSTNACTQVLADARNTTAPAAELQGYPRLAPAR